MPTPITRTAGPFNANHVAKAQEHPLLLSKDMVALKRIRQLELFLSLKRDLALVSSPTYSTKNGFPSSILFSILAYFFVIHVQAI